MIGFENGRLISLSVTLIDSLLARAPREQLLALLARSFHAAVQARNIAGYVLSRHEEEVFIAALLFDLGELAFRSEEHTSELQSLMRISYAVFCLKKKKNYRMRYEQNIHHTVV